MDRFKKKTDENGERTSLKIKISMRKTAKMIAVVKAIRTRKQVQRQNLGSTYLNFKEK